MVEASGWIPPGVIKRSKYLLAYSESRRGTCGPDVPTRNEAGYFKSTNNCDNGYYLLQWLLSEKALSPSQG